MNALNSLPVIDHCWSKIGVKGDQTCVRLEEFVHCHNCPVFAEAAQLFLDRPLPDDYTSELTPSLTQLGASRASAKALSVAVFEVAGQLLAIESHAIVEVTETRPVHRVGRRSGHVFLGIVNVHGQLELCASLRGLLQITADGEAQDPSIQKPRMILIELAHQRWVFPVDRVHGVERFAECDLRDIPATARQDSGSLVTTVLKWNDRRVGLLDVEKALFALEAHIR